MITNMMRRAMISDSATLSLDFTQMSTLADLTSRGLTFSRSTSGTYINASGLVATATAGNPRFEYDPSTLQPRGLLIEGSASNVLQYSEAVDQSPWFTAGTVARATFTGGNGPNGVNNSGSKLSATSISSASSLYYNGLALTAQTYTMSVFAKADGANWIWVSIQQGATIHGAFFDLSGNGALGNTTGTVVSGSNIITKYPNGWFRIQFSFTGTASVWFPVLLPCTSNGTGYASIAGQAPNGVLVYGCMFETGSGASSYIPTGASQGSRANESLYLDGASFAAFWPSGQSEFSVYFAGDITRPPANTQFLWLSRTGSGGVGASRSRSFITTANSIRANTTVNDLNSTLSAAINTRIRTAVGVRSGSCALATNNGTTSTIVVNTDTGLSTDATQLVFNPNADVFQHVSSLKFWPTRLPDAQLQALIT
jgi:hypothetical protein